MTRRRIIAGVILLAAVAVAVPFGPGLWARAWLGFAYEEVFADRAFYREERKQRTITYVSFAPPIHVPFALPDDLQNYVLDEADEPDEAAEPWAFRVMTKRWSWIPGHQHIVPDQVCAGCQVPDHAYCFHGATTESGCTLPDGTDVRLPATFRCTCTDPSHDGD